MKEWEDSRFKPLLTSNIWHTNSEEIKQILSLEQWKDPRFEPLLTSSIWSSNYKKVKEILEMKEWDNSKYHSLLSPSVWNTTKKVIQKKLELPYWDNPIYERLLSPTIFAISIDNITKNIELFEEYGIEQHITTRALSKNNKEMRTLLDYLIKNGVNLVVDSKLNPILSATKKTLKEKYGIDIKKISKEGISHVR